MAINMIDSNYKELNCEYRFSSIIEAIDINQLFIMDVIDYIGCLTNDHRFSLITGMPRNNTLQCFLVTHNRRSRIEVTPKYP